MKTTYYTNEYEASHGKSPKGYGSWAFSPYGDPDSIEWVNQSTYTEAKRTVAKIHPQIKEWIVLP